MALRTMLASSPNDRSCKRGPGIACLCILLICALLQFTSPRPAMADWSRLWSENFETRHNPSLKLETFGPRDRLIIMQDGTAKCRNYVLVGESRDEAAGNGFQASSPTFDELGLIPARAYTVKFRYRVPDNCFCWTYAMATRDACLVVSECDGSGQAARIGLVDQYHQNFQPMGKISIGDWHDMEIQVLPVQESGERVLRVLVDGQNRGSQIRAHPSEYDRFMFMDLPARISEIGISNPHGDGCFGSGNWDDIEVWADMPRDRPRDKDRPEIHVSPSPFNPTTEIAFEMRGAGLLNVDIYDLSGRHVRHLFGGTHSAGPVRMTWRGRNDRGSEVSSGVYIIRVATPLGVQTNRAVLIR